MASCFSVDCVWGVFTEWSVCSEICGGGIKTRSRSQLLPASNGGKECEGKAMEQMVCNTDPCEIDCKWGPFGDWSLCSNTCGDGKIFRTRSVETPALNGGKECLGEQMETETCNVQTCLGIWFLSSMKAVSYFESLRDW